MLRERPLDEELLLPLFAALRAEGVVLTGNQSAGALVARYTFPNARLIEQMDISNAVVGVLLDRANAAVLAPLRGRGLALMRDPVAASSPELAGLVRAARMRVWLSRMARPIVHHVIERVYAFPHGPPIR